MTLNQIAEDLQSRYKVAKSQLSLCPPVGADVDDHWEGIRFNCEETMELIERISRVEVERDALKLRLQRMTPTQEMYEPGRCQVCGWPLAGSVEDGCVEGNCSMRPREGSEEYYRLKERREWLSARAAKE